MIPNPGVYVSTIAELHLKVVCFMAKHYVWTSHTLTPEMDTMAKFHQNNQSILYQEWPERLALYNGQKAQPLSLFATLMLFPQKQ
jgi:hypothetical protein